MDQELLKLLTRLKIQGKKIMGLEIDIVRLNSDRPYAALILEQLASSEHEELVMSAIEFMDRLGLVNASAAMGATATEGERSDEPAQEKYIYSLR